MSRWFSLGASTEEIDAELEARTRARSAVRPELGWLEFLSLGEKLELRELLPSMSRGERVAIVGGEAGVRGRAGVLRRRARRRLERRFQVEYTSFEGVRFGSTSCVAGERDCRCAVDLLDGEAETTVREFWCAHAAQFVVESPASDESAGVEPGSPSLVDERPVLPVVRRSVSGVRVERRAVSARSGDERIEAATGAQVSVAPDIEALTRRKLGVH